jgi:transposase
MNQEKEARTLDQLYALRKQVVRLSLAGKPVMEIVALTGLSWTGVRKALDLYASGGIAALKPAKRGRKAGTCRVLSAEEERRIRAIICDKRPEQLKMDFALWSRAAVMALIKQECGIDLQVRSVGKYLARWGFTPQKPIRKAYEQNEAAVKQWLEESYPAIKAQARAEGGEIHWGDETALVNTDVRGRSYAPAGKTPVTRTIGGTRQKLSMIATVTNQGKTRWMIIDEAFNADRLIEFLEALIKEAGRKVFLILDNLRVHHSKPVKEWLSTRQDKIEIFYLPSYSPELNPEERLNGDLKQAIGKKVPIRTKAKLRAATTAHMEQLEREPERVMAYFRDPHVRYAAS